MIAERVPPVHPVSPVLDNRTANVERGLVAYEFKWNPSQAARARAPKAFSEAYPDATWTPVSRDNYVEFVTGLI